ncbi:MAG: outer membrane protein assembly factor [Cypionkella sp.]
MARTPAPGRSPAAGELWRDPAGPCVDPPPAGAAQSACSFAGPEGSAAQAQRSANYELRAAPGQYLADLPGGAAGSLRGSESSPEERADPFAEAAQQARFGLSRGGLAIGGGYSTIEGPNAHASLTRSHFPGLGQEMSIYAGISRIRRAASVNFASARTFGDDMRFSSALFAVQDRAVGFADRFRTAPFRQTSFGVKMALQKELGPVALGLGLHWSRDEFRLRTGGACAAELLGSLVCRETGVRPRTVVTASADFDRRDSKSAPTKGYRIRMAHDITLPTGPYRYLRSQIGAEGYILYGDEWTIAVSGEAGGIWALGGRTAPLFDRFYLGGSSLRGFDLRGISPRLVPSAEEGARVAVGGDRYYSARVELAGRLGGADAQGLQPSLFVDAGSAWGVKQALDTDEQLLGNSRKPRVSIGAGLRWMTPAGVVRFDIAMPVIKQPGDRRQLFTLSVGQTI